MADESAYRERLGHAQFVKERPRQILETFLAFKTECEAGNHTESEAILQQLLKQLQLYEFNAGKIQVVSDTCDREVEAHSALQTDIERQMQTTQAEVDALRVQLADERVKRKNLEEYDALAAQVEQQPTRADTERKIVNLTGELGELEGENSATMSRMNLRKKQFQLLLHVVSDLQSALEDIEGKEGLSVMVEKTAEADDGNAAAADLEDGEDGEEEKQ